MVILFAVFTRAYFILVQFIKYVLCDCFLYGMLVNVNSIYYVHACEQAR